MFDLSPYSETKMLWIVWGLPDKNIIYATKAANIFFYVNPITTNVLSTNKWARG